MTLMGKPAPSSEADWLSATRKRVEQQRALVETLKPGSDAHRSATNLLLMYQDSLHVLTEATELITKLKRDRRK